MFTTLAVAKCTVRACVCVQREIPIERFVPCGIVSPSLDLVIIYLFILLARYPLYEANSSLCTSEGLRSRKREINPKYKHDPIRLWQPTSITSKGSVLSVQRLGLHWTDSLQDFCSVIPLTWGHCGRPSSAIVTASQANPAS
jgi:hypothetical protein